MRNLKKSCNCAGYGYNHSASRNEIPKATVCFRIKLLFLIPKNPIYGGLLVVFPLYVVVIAQIAAFACGAKGCRFEFCQGH
ncbi:MAG TPA: hypothetical protein PKX41_14075, partial [Anaerolineaceae bacterium]|nr:hypothetical protein [Anaerolineaceae bacterium]